MARTGHQRRKTTAEKDNRHGGIKEEDKLLQINVLRLDGGGEEERCGLREAVRIFCGQVVAGAHRE